MRIASLRSTSVFLVLLAIACGGGSGTDGSGSATDGGTTGGSGETGGSGDGPTTAGTSADSSGGSAPVDTSAEGGTSSADASSGSAGSGDSSSGSDSGGDDTTGGLGGEPNVLYVHPDGSNGDAGTIDAPMRTIQWAISQAVGQGGIDTIRVAEGDYCLLYTSPSPRD